MCLNVATCLALPQTSVAELLVPTSEHDDAHVMH